MFEATRQARERALAGEGPTLLEAVTMRMHGHAAHDDMKYVPKEQVEEWRKKDPIERQEARLRDLGVDPGPSGPRSRGDRRRLRRRRSRCRCPTPTPRPTASSHDGPDELVLGDGNAPVERLRRGGLHGGHDLPAGDLRRACARRCAPTTASW